MRNPGAADVFEAERFGIARDAFDVIAVAFVAEVGADGVEVVGIELGFELFGREIVGAGEFDVFDAPALDFIRGVGDILGELGAEAVKLETDGAFEAGAGSGAGMSSGRVKTSEG